MIRRVIQIDDEKCNGCGLCVSACHEGAIQLVNGKAKLVRDDYCDGLGDCLPSCPVDAISFVEREAAPYDEAAVIAAKMANAKAEAHSSMPAQGCPGSMAKLIERETGKTDSTGPSQMQGVSSNANTPAQAAEPSGGIQVTVPIPSRLSQWPIQIKLAPTNAAFFDGADLLIAADCTAFSYGAFHEDFIKGCICLIGCPKLDGVDYTEKLTEILANNDIKSVRVARMQVPCCGGIEHAARQAVDRCGKDIPISVATIASDGTIVSEA